jgi:hypothetical protein
MSDLAAVTAGMMGWPVRGVLNEPLQAELTPGREGMLSGASAAASPGWRQGDAAAQLLRQGHRGVFNGSVELVTALSLEDQEEDGR